nr:SlyX family protein [uncultured Kingella sp.]
MDGLENRIAELEIRLALQDDLLESLNNTIVKMRETLDLQQEQLRLLYARTAQQGEPSGTPYNVADEIPPHY